MSERASEWGEGMVQWMGWGGRGREEERGRETHSRGSVSQSSASSSLKHIIGNMMVAVISGTSGSIIFQVCAGSSAFWKYLHAPREFGMASDRKHRSASNTHGHHVGYTPQREGVGKERVLYVPEPKFRHSPAGN